MSAVTEPRTWDATVAYSHPSHGTVVLAHRAPRLARTLRDTCRAAEATAAAVLRSGLYTEARVLMHKTTKAHGRREDRQGAYLWADRGTVYADRDRSC